MLKHHRGDANDTNEKIKKKKTIYYWVRKKLNKCSFPFV